MYEYDDEFFSYISDGAALSALKVLPELVRILPSRPESALDVGCGAGAWLSVWKSLGVQVLGLDGTYVKPRKEYIDSNEFRAVDLARKFDLGRRFSIVQSLEVAEHLPVTSAEGFVASLCRHGDLVLFSAAPPGQGGENHINEQPYDYWRDIFAVNGFRMYDALRSRLLEDRDIKPWYRFNTFVYASDSADPEIIEALYPFKVSEVDPVPDLSPAAYRLRKRAVALLPRSASTALARVKKYYFNATSRPPSKPG